MGSAFRPLDRYPAPPGGVTSTSESEEWAPDETAWARAIP
jgi:hypothetical protein